MRRRTKPTVLQLGSISTGSCRFEDIAPELVSALEALRLSRADRATLRQLSAEVDAFYAFENENGPQPDGEEEDVLSEIYDLAQAYAPDYCYVGSHPGDGADIGCWPSEEILDGPGGYYSGEVASSRESATSDHSHALEVNDHGNATLYRRAGRRWVECWSVV